jgi:integrase/recombinase XerD
MDEATPAPGVDAHETGKVSDNAASGAPVRRKRKPRRLPRSLPARELSALVAAAPPGRDRLLLRAGIGMGLRVSELTKLEVPDLDLAAGTALVREGKGGKDRSVPVPDWLAAELARWLGARTAGHVFPSPRGGRLSSRTVQRVIKRAAVKAGLPGAEDVRRYTPHKLRHTFATNCLRAGADIIEVRDLLGHSSVSTTQVYLSSDASRLRDAVNRIPPPEAA